jgi:hypothetical protein
MRCSDPGWAECNADLNLPGSDGCETDSSTSVTSCGGCGNDCTFLAPDHMTATGCSLSVCQFACQRGYANCNVDLSDGCEVDLSSDQDHCGACGAASSRTNGTPLCTSGMCSMSCNSTEAYDDNVKVALFYMLKPGAP